MFTTIKMILKCLPVFALKDADRTAGSAGQFDFGGQRADRRSDASPWTLLQLFWLVNSWSSDLNLLTKLAFDCVADTHVVSSVAAYAQNARHFNLHQLLLFAASDCQLG